MSRFDLESVAVPGPSTYTAGQNLRVDIAGPGRVDAHKSSLLLPIEKVTSGNASDYLDSVVGTWEDMTLYLNNQAVMTIQQFGLIMSAYVHKLKSAEWQNNEGVSRLGLDVKEYAVAGTDTDGTAIRIASWDVVRRHNIPLSYLGFMFKGGQIPCYNRLKWTVEIKLRSDAESTVGGGTSGDTQPTYRYNIPTLRLHRVVSEAETASFNSQFASGLELDVMYWSTLIKSAAQSAAFPVIDNTLNQRVDGQLVIQRLDSSISGSAAKLAQSMTAFEHNGLTDFHVQYPSGQRMPRSGDFDVTKATGTYECYQALKDIKFDMEEYLEPEHDRYLGCGPSINGLIANADGDFMLAVRPQTREQGVASWNLTGTAAAACKIYVFSMSKAKLRIDSSGSTLLV